MLSPNPIRWSAALALLVALCSSPVAAQDTSLQQYDVELVVFRVTNPNNTAEDWSLEEARAKAALPTIADAEEATPAPEAATPPSAPIAPATGEGSESSFQPIDAAQFRMAAIETTLRRNRNYQVLAHVAWSQPGFTMSNPVPFALDGLLPQDAGLSGTVTLVRGKYLHMTLDIGMQSSDGKRYILREQRRMRRSGEKHYFDHPYFGVIALVTPKN